MKEDFIVREAVVSLLVSWQNFYVIIGSAAAALTGLMFVVITLAAGTQRRRGSESVAAFNTPTVVYFGTALLTAAVMSAPWPMLWNVGLLLGLCGLAGIIYVIIVIRRIRHQKNYQPVLEDWLWHTIFPLVSYTSLIVAAIMLPGNLVLALFIVAAVTALLLFIGIHNSWDTVTYIAFVISQQGDESQD